MSVPGYRERLRVEGLVLAGCGALGSVALIAAVPESRRWPWNTVGQLAVVAGLMATLGRRAVRRSMERAVEAVPGGEGSGEATPLWELPVIVVGLATPFALLPHTGLPGSHLAGWDAALRITGGCTLAGLAQAVLYAGMVGGDERRRGRRYVRGPGSSLLGGTKLLFTRAG